MIKSTLGLLLFVYSFVASSELPAFADALKCSDAQEELKREIEPIVDVAVKSTLPSFKPDYAIGYTKFYAINETDNSKDCAATVGLTMEDGLHSESEVRYRLVMTEDGQVLTQFQSFNWKSLVAGILMASIKRAQNGMPADQAAKEFYAPQGPGSFADQMRKYNREGSVGPRKSPPRE